MSIGWFNLEAKELKEMNVEVFNVGQGDSLLLRSDYDCAHCYYNGEPCEFPCCRVFEETDNYCDYNEPMLLIDCGAKFAKVSDRLPHALRTVLLTHSHTDHIGGFPKIYKENRIDKLIIPYYLPEIMNIAKFLVKKVPKIYGVLNWREFNDTLNIHLVSEGDRLGEHIKILNPPRNPRDFFYTYLDENMNIQGSLRDLNEYGFELPVEEIINYETPLIDSLPDREEYAYFAKEFVHLFFSSLSKRISTNHIKSAASYLATAHIQMTANQASIIFKYQHVDGDWLFTGDADQFVFDRLIDKDEDLSAKYLKVPHHGSRENMSMAILNAINPEVAIVSHNNGRFGRSKDTHPHSDVIDLLDNNKVRTYYTNSVIKNGVIIKQATVNLVENDLLSFN